MRIVFFFVFILSSFESFARTPWGKGEWRSFAPFKNEVTPTEIREKDSNNDGHADRVETFYQIPKYNLLVIKTKISTKFNSIFDRQWITHTKLNELKDEVGCEVIDDVIKKLDQDVNQVKITLLNDYYQTNWGYRIHRSCLEKWGEKNFLNALKNSSAKGLQCLKDLAQINTEKFSFKKNGALLNLIQFNKLLKTNRVSIVCHENNYNWSDVAAHASTGPEDFIGELKLKHPYVSINSNYPRTSGADFKKEINDLSRTLFHEQFHNLSIRHTKDLEYPYTCETCCLGEASQEEKLAACRICSGRYESVTDEDYLMDLLNWGNITYHSDQAARAIIAYEKEFPDKRFGLFAYADASSGIFGPVGIELGKILMAKFTNLSEQEKKFIEHSQKYAQVESLKKLSPYAKIAAESHILLFYDRNPEKTLDLLAKNAPLIKELIQKIPQVEESKRYPYKELKDKFYSILVDIWLNNYPDHKNPHSDRAYKILTDTSLL